MTTLRIGFAKMNIDPPHGLELGGYAGVRPCAGNHDPLWCKAMVLEQAGVRYGLVMLDLLCVDEALQQAIAEAVAEAGIGGERLIVAAIHSHAAPVGVLPGKGPLAGVNQTIIPQNPAFEAYMQQVIHAAAAACRQAAAHTEPFCIRTACGAVPAVASERHTGESTDSKMTLLHIRTESGREAIVYHFPCHPTVLSAANLLSSEDLVATVEAQLGVEMAMFVNGAAGDISTRFTRREASFAECARMGELVARQAQTLLRMQPFTEPTPLKGITTRVTLQARQVETVATAQMQLQQATERWRQAEKAGLDATELRILKSYVEGAGVNLEFAQTMGDIRQLALPVTVFRFCGLDFAAVPGELFSTLQPKGVAVIGYANGYYRYIADLQAYEKGYYEAMAAILAPGEGEKLTDEITKLRQQLDQ